jgi:UDP-N-acetyl-2-amino-2-deoxyglucuronate dehydrogenase
MNFALIGAAGYIAPRHMKAIKETDNVLVAALDKNDSVGIIDSFFPEADFFIEPERFDRHLDKLRRIPGKKVDYVSICSPNFLHDAHIRLAIRNEAHAICEKPVVLNPWNIAALAELEKETGKNIYTILQLRHHSSIINLKKAVESRKPEKKYDVDLTYITGRGNWYHFSWKGDTTKSGGIATNIGIHFFDMLVWIFGEMQSCEVHLSDKQRAAGFMELENARVRWFLSVNADDIPEQQKKDGKRTYRSIMIENEDIEFSDGFTDLHTVSYQEILAGKGFRVSEAMKSVIVAHKIRNATTTSPKSDYHPYIQKLIKQ